MQLNFKPFQTFINHNTTLKTRIRYTDSTIASLECSNYEIKARVMGSRQYEVFIEFNPNEVIAAKCSCPYDQSGYCKHIVHVLVKADKLLQQGYHLPEIAPNSNKPDPRIDLKQEGKTYIISHQHLLQLTNLDIETICVKTGKNLWQNLEIIEAQMTPNKFIAKIKYSYIKDFHLHIVQNKDALHLECSCSNRSPTLICEHLRTILLRIINQEIFQLPFDEKLRFQYLKNQANKDGLEKIQDLDDIYQISLSYDRLFIKPKYSFLSLSPSELSNLKRNLLPDFEVPKTMSPTTKQEFILAENYMDYGLQFKLMEAPLSKNGKMKSPIRAVNLKEKSKSLSTPEEFLFMTMLFEQQDESLSFNDHLAILKNPLDLPFYYYESSWREEKITPGKIKPVKFFMEELQSTVSVTKKEGFYSLKLRFIIKGETHYSTDLKQIGNYIQIADNFYLLKGPLLQKLFTFFSKNKHDIFLPAQNFADFKKGFLDPLEHILSVEYSFIKKAPKNLIREQALDQVTEQKIYLSEADDYILITPVICYGEIETPILSRQNMYAEDDNGKMYVIDRDVPQENKFKRNIQTQHHSFEDAPKTEFYYLHKQEFLEEGWFVNAFEAWRDLGYTILGFKQLKNNSLNPHKIKVQDSVSSGIDWFDIHTDITFGNQKVSLKEIRKSVVNKKRFVLLGDGTKGFLPNEWIEKFSRYFRSGEIKADSIRAPKSQFSFLDEMFEKETLSPEVKIELESYREKLADFHSIANVKTPKKLKANLRDYQKEGLNWLNFLDEFGFGGCLADDMGLGKTIQILTYFLLQLEKGNKRPNLVVVPTSLLHNWEIEIMKFAPHLKYTIIYGIDRNTKEIAFENYALLITSYGIMLNDIKILREINFNIIVLDESQAIKNPASKRYKAARLLKARQRIVATGTPIENNTFDLYAQLSFAVPGLFGNARQFAADYSTPIDKFQDEARARELQQKIKPFILRRTKKEVATELPEKTEIVVYCEMGKEQRRVYDTYKKEFQDYLESKNDDDLKNSSMHILQGLTKLRQICNSPALLSDNEYYGEESAKLDELIDQVLQIYREHKILIFSQFVGMLNLIKERLHREGIKYAFFTGQTRNRQKEIVSFQEDEGVRIFLISLKAGGTGLNLTEAEYVFIVDPWWNPAVENQAIDRAYRIGQINKVIALRMICTNSIEEKILELQDRKRKLAEDIIHTDSGFFKQLNKTDLMNLV